MIVLSQADCSNGDVTTEQRMSRISATFFDSPSLSITSTASQTARISWGVLRQRLEFGSRPSFAPLPPLWWPRDCTVDDGCKLRIHNTMWQVTSANTDSTNATDDWMHSSVDELLSICSFSAATICVVFSTVTLAMASSWPAICGDRELEDDRSFVRSAPEFARLGPSREASDIIPWHLILWRCRCAKIHKRINWTERQILPGSTSWRLFPLGGDLVCCEAWCCSPVLESEIHRHKRWTTRFDRTTGSWLSTCSLFKSSLALQRLASCNLRVGCVKTLRMFLNDALKGSRFDSNPSKDWEMKSSRPFSISSNEGEIQTITTPSVKWASLSPHTLSKWRSLRNKWRRNLQDLPCA